MLTTSSSSPHGHCMFSSASVTAPAPSPACWKLQLYTASALPTVFCLHAAPTVHLTRDLSPGRVSSRAACTNTKSQHFGALQVMEDLIFPSAEVLFKKLKEAFDPADRPSKALLEDFLPCLTTGDDRYGIAPTGESSADSCPAWQLPGAGARSLGGHVPVPVPLDPGCPGFD